MHLSAARSVVTLGAPRTNPAAPGLRLPGGTGVCVAQGQPRGLAQEAPGHLMGSEPCRVPERSSSGDALRFRPPLPAAGNAVCVGRGRCVALRPFRCPPSAPGGAKQGPGRLDTSPGGPSLRNGPALGAASAHWAAAQPRTRRVPRPSRPATVTHLRVSACAPAGPGAVPRLTVTLLLPQNLCESAHCQDARGCHTATTREASVHLWLPVGGRQSTETSRQQGCPHRAGPLPPASPKAHFCRPDAPGPGPSRGEEASPAP